MKLGFFGCGNMGEAFLKSILKKGIYSSEEIRACSRTEKRAKVLWEKYNIAATTEAQDLQQCDILFLGFKPQNLADISFIPKENMIVISMLAGKIVSVIQAKFPNAKIVRIMPNVGQFVGQGMTGLFFDPQSSFTGGERGIVRSLLESGGMVLELEREEQIDWIGAISGSGPAYFFRFAEALQHSAQTLGFTPEQAESLVRQTFIGSAHLLQKNPNDSCVLWREKVTSRGGTTEQALRVFNENNLDGLVQVAIEAAMKRTKELGGV